MPSLSCQNGGFGNGLDEELKFLANVEAFICFPSKPFKYPRVIPRADVQGKAPDPFKPFIFWGE